MSVLSSLTNSLDPTQNTGILSGQYQPTDQYQPTTSDDRGCENQNGREQSKNDDHEKQAKYDDHSKDSKYDDHSQDGRYGDHSKDGQYGDHSKDGQYGDHSKDGQYDDHSKDARYDCQPQKDYCASKSADTYGKGDTHGPGAELSKFDFSHGDYGSHAPDHSGDMHGALASMSSGHALDYAIGQMSPADHADVGHFDVSHDTSHDMAHHG
jgi:hypothetical protein